MKRARIKSRGTVVLLAGVLVMAALLYTAYRAGGPPSALILGPPVLTNNQFQITVTNVSRRKIFHQLCPPHFKIRGEWEAPDVPMVLLNSGPKVLQSSLMVPGEGLEPGDVQTLSGTVPRHITAPFDGSAWRVAVVWNYDGQTVVEEFWYRFQTWISGQPPHALPVMHTNFSPEVTIGSSRLPKHLYP